MLNGRRFPYSIAATRLRLIRILGLFAIASGVMTMPLVVGAASSLPTIGSFAIQVRDLPPEGGKFTLTASVANSSTCTFSVVPAIKGLPATINCTNASTNKFHGYAVVETDDQGNASTTPIHYKFSLSVTNSSGTTKSTIHPTLTQHSYKWNDTTKSLTFIGTATSISCVGNNFCVVTSSKGTLGVISTKTRNTNLTDIYVFRSVSCASHAMCVAVDSTGTFVTWNGAKWSSPTPVPTGSSGTGPDLVSISCPTSTFCMALDSAGDAYSIASVPLHGTLMHASALGPTVVNPLVSCSSATACLLTDRAGDAVGWNGTMWTTIGVVDATGVVTALSCSPDGTCTIVDSHGGVVAVSVGYTYAKHAAILDNQQTVSCPTHSYCLATDGVGHASQEVNGVWSLPFMIGNNPPVALSCGVGKTSPVGVTCGAVSRNRIPGNMKWGVIALK